MDIEGNKDELEIEWKRGSEEFLTDEDLEILKAQLETEDICQECWDPDCEGC